MHTKKLEVQDYYRPIKSELLLVQQKISEQIQSSDPDLSLVLEEISKRQGKMLRPAMVLLCGKLISDINDEHINLASIVELIHIASLLHDDVIDKAQLRRGKPSANALWGNTAAVLLGDFLLSRAFTLASGCQLNGTASVLGQTIESLCTGELKQNLLMGEYDFTEEDYFQIIEAKTAALFGCSCQLGAMVAGASKQQSSEIREFGFLFGLAFQIADDLRDVLSSEQQEGKTLGTDLLDGKLTLPVIHWINQDPDQRQARISQLSKLDNTGQFIKQLRQTGSIDYALQDAQMRVKRAKQLLHPFPSTPSADALLALTDQVIADII